VETAVCARAASVSLGRSRGNSTDSHEKTEGGGNTQKRGAYFAREVEMHIGCSFGRGLLVLGLGGATNSSRPSFLCDDGSSLSLMPVEEMSCNLFPVTGMFFHVLG
jgi:hypothetical protein